MQDQQIIIEFSESYTVVYSQTEGVTVTVKGECEIDHYEGTNDIDDQSETNFHFSNVFMCINEVSTESLRKSYKEFGRELTQQDIDDVNVWIAVNTDFETEFAYSVDKPHLKDFIEQVKDYCLEAAANYESDET
jgi:hypothetical protein